MKVQLEQITSHDDRRTNELTTGEIVEHTVELSFGDQNHSFNVYLKANMFETFDGSVIYGDDQLEEILKTEPAALNQLYSAVGSYRGEGPERVDLPMTLAEIDVGSAGKDRDKYRPSR